MADEKNADVGRPSLTPAEVRAEKRALQRMQHRQPPPSMWTAPQSRIPPPNPADIPTSEVAEKYFRRVAVPNMLNGPPPTRGQRIANIAGGVLGCTVGLYLILLHDFGTPDHVFMPVSLVEVLIWQAKLIVLSIDPKVLQS
jgi:hypothetical protein